MSCNRENVTWIDPQGRWFIGFYPCTYIGDEDGDYEWDVEYDYDRFASVYGPARSADEAYAMWPGANPGGTTIYEVYNADTKSAIDAFEAMRAAYEKAEAEYRRDNPPMRRLYGGLAVTW